MLTLCLLSILFITLYVCIRLLQAMTRPEPGKIEAMYLPPRRLTMAELHVARMDAKRILSTCTNQIRDTKRNTRADGEPFWVYQDTYDVLNNAYLYLDKEDWDSSRPLFYQSHFTRNQRHANHKSTFVFPNVCDKVPQECLQ